MCTKLLQNCVPPDQYRTTYLENDIIETILGISVNFNLLANIMNAIGNFEYKGVNYNVKIPEFELTNSLNVTFANLRQTVTNLAKRHYDREARLYF